MPRGGARAVWHGHLSHLSRPQVYGSQSLAPDMNDRPLFARALQLAERIDLKGLERAEQFSSNPLAFKVATGGTVVLFRFGTAVFLGMNPLEEEAIVTGL